MVLAAALEQQSLARVLKQAEKNRFRTDGPPVHRLSRTDARPEPELLSKLLIFVDSEMAALGGASVLTVPSSSSLD